MKSITSQLLTSLLITTLLISCWGEPESKLKKTTENIVKVENFESFLGTSWSNDKNDKSTSEISFDIEGLKDTKGYFEDFDILFKVSDNNPEDAKIKVGQVAEGARTLQVVFSEAEKMGISMPMVKSLHGILFSDSPSDQLIQDLLDHPNEVDVEFTYKD